MNKVRIGDAVRRGEDSRLLQGRGRYVDDVAGAGQARAYVLRSPYAHAEIAALDVSAARAAPGVLAVLTAEEMAAGGWAV